MAVATSWQDSAGGRAALTVAAREARLRSTELLVLHVQDARGAEQAQRSASARVEAAVRAQLAADATDVPWSLVVGTAVHDAAQVLVDLAVEHRVDVLVIGSRRRSPIGKLVVGSTVQRVLLDCPLPVLVVKAPR